MSDDLTRLEQEMLDTVTGAAPDPSDGPAKHDVPHELVSLEIRVGTGIVLILPEEKAHVMSALALAAGSLTREASIARDLRHDLPDAQAQERAAHIVQLLAQRLHTSTLPRG